MKFKKESDLEQYLLSTYINQTDVDVQYELQYINVEKANEETHFSIVYSKQKDSARKSTDVNKQTARLRNSTKTSKEKARQRNASEASKEKACQRNATEAKKEKCRKRKSTEIEKEKCRIRNSAKVKREKLASEKPFDRIIAFQKAIQDGPYYICVVCNRTLYRKTVKFFHESKYETTAQNIFTNV